MKQNENRNVKKPLKQGLFFGLLLLLFANVVTAADVPELPGNSNLSPKRVSILNINGTTSGDSNLPDGK
jgi:hypothetical protein